MLKEPLFDVDVRARVRGSKKEWEFRFRFPAGDQRKVLTEARGIVRELERVITSREYAIFVQGKQLPRETS